METNNVKLVHATKNNSPEEPVSLAFAITDDSGREEIYTINCRADDLLQVLQEQGWGKRIPQSASAPRSISRRTA